MTMRKGLHCFTSWVCIMALLNFMFCERLLAYEVGQTIVGNCVKIANATTIGGPESGVCASRDVTYALYECQSVTNPPEAVYCTTTMVEAGYIIPYGMVEIGVDWVVCAFVITGLLAANTSVAVACAFACGVTLGAGCAACIAATAPASVITAFAFNEACTTKYECQAGQKKTKQKVKGC